MTKSIIRFSFPGNIVWGSAIKNNWANILLDYVIRELTIGNGTFINIEPCLTKKTDYNLLTADHYPKKHIITEVICNIPKSMERDEFDIRARVITILEDRTFDFIKFHNCGPSGEMSITADKLRLSC
jgi:hypothetical protein